MTYLDYSVLSLEYKDQEELFIQLKNALTVQPEFDGRIVSIKSIIQVDKNLETGKYEAYAILEQDLSKILVEFTLHDSIFVFDKILEHDEKDSETCIIMSYEEIKFINSLGKITIDNETFKIKSMDFVLNSPEENDGDDSRRLVIGLTELDKSEEE